MLVLKCDFCKTEISDNIIMRGMKIILTEGNDFEFHFCDFECRAKFSLIKIFNESKNS